MNKAYQTWYYSLDLDERGPKVHDDGEDTPRDPAHSEGRHHGDQNPDGSLRSPGLVLFDRSVLEHMRDASVKGGSEHQRQDELNEEHGYGIGLKIRTKVD